jgi:hypothetical protein
MYVNAAHDRRRKTDGTNVSLPLGILRSAIPSLPRSGQPQVDYHGAVRVRFFSMFLFAS